MEKLIIFYQSFYENLLKQSIRDDIEILAWIPCDTIPAVTDYIQTHFSLFQTTNLTICLMTSKFQIQAVIRQFLSILGIDSSQILDIYQLYLHKLPIKQYQQIIRSCTAPLDGMIFVISHGQAGILEDLLPGNALNFCSSSQDIYFNTKILSALAEESYNAICHTKYIIFDMFDYTYFNFDTILTNECQNYLTANGFFCENRHDYHHSQSVDDINHCLTEIFALRSDTSAFQRFLTLFPQIHCPDVQEYQNEYRKLMRPDTTLHQDAIAAYLSPSTPVFSSIQRHVYEPTIQFQIANFAEFLHLVYCINPNIKVIGVLLPKYYVVEETEQTVNQLWKPYFENIVSSFQEKYANFTFCDLKNLTDISHNPDFYQDLTHLNFEGARHLTNYIVSAISEHS